MNKNQSVGSDQFLLVDSQYGGYEQMNEEMTYHFVGIKGTGMSTLAQILHDLGNTVSGYDDARGHKFTQDGLEKRNIPIYYDNNHEIDSEFIPINILKLPYA